MIDKERFSAPFEYREAVKEMAKGNTQAEKLVTVITQDKTVVIWQAKRPMNDEQHATMARRLREESKKSGLKVMLVPHSVDVSLSALVEKQANPIREDNMENNEQGSGTNADDSIKAEGNTDSAGK